ncbi:MAG: glycosyltransferase family 4 protein [Nitrosospira sp.]|nr:glycosyltransferase family 4 protein [Nitrosospira sp.]
MRICFIAHSAEMYGAELALLELLQGLVNEGSSCMVLVPENGPFLAEIDRMRVEWQIINYPTWRPRRRKIINRFIRTLKASLAAIPMAQAITRWQPDVVYTNTVVIGVGAVAAWLARCPHVWHLHEFGHINPEELFDLGNHRTARLIDSLSAGIIANSRAVKNEYARYINPQKLHVIYQSVTLNEESKYAAEPIERKQVFRCVMVGSLQPLKGQQEAIAALAELARRGFDAELMIVGAGSSGFRQVLENDIKRYGLEQHVVFHGYVENPMSLIHAADVVLMCSRFESFGRVTVEAMLAGKPVIGAASGGTAELIQAGKTGLLYESGNYNDLAGKIQYLFENPEKKIKLGADARAWATGRFTQKRYARDVLDLLDGVLAKPANTRHA